MFRKLILAVVVGVLTTLVCLFVGGLLLTMEVSWVVATGAFLKTFAGLLGLMAALWHFFAGFSWPVKP